MTKLHQLLPKVCEDHFYSNEFTLDRVELYSELLRIKTIWNTAWIFGLKAKKCFFKLEDMYFKQEHLHIFDFCYFVLKDD